MSGVPLQILAVVVVCLLPVLMAIAAAAVPFAVEREPGRAPGEEE